MSILIQSTNNQSKLSKMKKVIFLAVMAVLGLSPMYAQQMNVGSNAANLGIGFGSSLNGLGSGRPAISASFERGLWEAGPGVISLGAYVGNTGYTYKSSGYKYKWNYTIVGARGAYHFNGITSVPQLDPYGGAMIGYNIVSYSGSDEYSGSYGSGMEFSLFVGSRWFFTDNIAAFVELGYGVSYLNLGIAFKF